MSRIGPHVIRRHVRAAIRQQEDDAALMVLHGRHAAQHVALRPQSLELRQGLECWDGHGGHDVAKEQSQR